MSVFDVIGFDADDTLWHSEDGFRANEERFVELIAPYAPEGVEVKAALTATERKNLAAFGYGVKSFGLSFADQVIRPSGVRVRTPGDKQAFECTFASEIGREHGTIKAPKRVK